MKKNPVGIKNNRFNLVNSKLIFKGEVKSLLKDKFLKEGSVLLKVEEKSSVLGILNKVFKINIILIYILILMFFNSLMNELKVTVTPFIMITKYHAYNIKSFMLYVDEEDISLAIFMTIINSENDLLFYICKKVKKCQIAIRNNSKEFTTRKKFFGIYLLQWFFETMIVSNILRKSWYWLMLICDNNLVWKFPNINPIIVIIIISFVIEVIWGICSYTLNKTHFNKKFSSKDLMISIGISLVFWIKFIITL